MWRTHSFLAALLLGLVLVLLVGCSEQPTAPPDSAVPVSAATAEYRGIPAAITTSAPVVSYREATLASQLLAQVVSVKVEEGDRVEAGDLLAELDVREYQAELAAARAAAEEAADEARRLSRLLAEDSVSAAAARRAEREYKQARAEVKRLSVSVSYGHIVAPFTGVITGRYVHPGQHVDEKDPILELQDHNLLVARPALPEQQLAQLIHGQPAELRFAAHPDTLFSGTVRRIYPAARAGSRLFQVEVALDQRINYPVRPGFLAQIRLLPGARKDALQVPVDAVLTEQGESFVFRLAEDQATKVAVTTGDTYEGFVTIQDGLAEGDTVAAANLAQLSDGATVEVISQFRRRGFRNE